MRRRSAAQLDRTAARQLAVQAQGLGAPWELPPGKEGAHAVVLRLGYAQIDTIAVVERAHHHTLWARRHDYAPAMLHQLQAIDRRVFEYWRSGAACYLPIEDYPYYLSAMRRAASSPRHVHWIERHAEVMERVLARIREEGPLRAADFEPPPGARRGPWWDWTPAKHGLEALFLTGAVMVTERRSFQRVYDLTERVLPTDALTNEPTDEAMARWRVRRALASAGYLTRAQIEAEAGDERSAGVILAAMSDACQAAPVAVEGEGGAECWAWHEALRAVPWQTDAPPAVSILSPFDSLCGNRQRLRDLFGFAYKIECYTPAHRREHGYFCLPVLWGGRFVGRIDAKADRRGRVLVAKSVLLEPGIGDELAAPLVGELGAFASLNGCDSVSVERTVPTAFGAALGAALAARG